jgi:hypothetical protein
MGKVINAIINKILPTFKAGEGNGISARKTSAFVLMVLVVIAHIIAFNKSNFIQYIVDILLADYAMIAALFGLTTYESHKIRIKKTNENTEIQ